MNCPCKARKSVSMHSNRSPAGVCVEPPIDSRLRTKTKPQHRWRFTLVKPEEFTVRGKNYLVTMATDMNFLATGLAPLKEAFGLELGTGNPFALPCLPLSSATNIGRTARGAKANVGGMPRPQTESRGGNSTPGAGSKVRLTKFSRLNDFAMLVTSAAPHPHPAL